MPESDTSCLHRAKGLFVGEVDFWFGFSLGSLSVSALRKVRSEMPSLGDWAEGLRILQPAPGEGRKFVGASDLDE
jgi:hypothetical protein